MSFRSLNPAMQKVENIADRIAPTDLTVLVTGETGVGKGVVARRIHEMSRRSGEPFLKINSATLPNTLLESELYGYQKGAFTGAGNERQGRMESADHGTVFFDEIGELGADSQGKLLHMIQDREFTPLGSNRITRIDIRLIAATNRDLSAEVREGVFRSDLFYRLNEVHIHVPPLRERKEDIPPLVEHFLEKLRPMFPRKTVAPLAPADYDQLLEHSWPGNVRELENMVKNMLLLGDFRAAFRKVTFRVTATPQREINGVSLTELVRSVEEKVERRVISHALERNGWNRKHTATMLNISYRSLLAKIKRFDLAQSY